MVHILSYLLSYANFLQRIGRDRIGIFTGDRDKTAIKQFINRCAYTKRLHLVLIIGQPVAVTKCW